MRAGAQVRQINGIKLCVKAIRSRMADRILGIWRLIGRPGHIEASRGNSWFSDAQKGHDRMNIRQRSLALTKEERV